MNGIERIIAIALVALAVCLMILTSGCTATRITHTPSGGWKTERISILQQVKFKAGLDSLSQPYVDYGNEGGQEVVSKVTEGAVKALTR